MGVDSQMLVQVLVWLLVATSTGLLACLVWFALRVLSQLDGLTKLVTDGYSSIDKRLALLESWRDDFRSRRATDQISGD